MQETFSEKFDETSTVRFNITDSGLLGDSTGKKCTRIILKYENVDVCT